MNTNNKQQIISFVLPYHKVKFEDNIKNLILEIAKNFSNFEYEILLVKNKDYKFPIEIIEDNKILSKIKAVEILNNDLYHIRLFGINQASGKYICFLDIDDSYYFKNLANNLSLIIDNDYDMGSFSFSGNKKIKNKSSKNSFEIDYNFLLKNSLSMVNCIFKKALSKKITADLNVSYDEDVAILTQICQDNIKILYIDEPFILTNINEGSVSRTFKGQQLEAITVNKFLENITTEEQFQILLFRFVCPKLIDIKLISDRKLRNRSYKILKQYIKLKYNKKIINKVFKNRFLIMSCKPWFISLITFLVPRKRLIKIVCKQVSPKQNKNSIGEK